MDNYNSRAGKGLVNSETSGWKFTESRKRITREIAKAIVLNWPLDVNKNISYVNDLAERLEGYKFTSALDEADYNLKIKIMMEAIYTAFMVPGPKPLATSSNLSEAATSSGSNERVADVEVLYQKQVAKDSLEHEAPLSASTSDQLTPTSQRLIELVSSLSHKPISESYSEISEILHLLDILSVPFEISEISDRKISSSHNAMPFTSEPLNLDPWIDPNESDLNSVRSQDKGLTNEEKHALLAEIEEVKKLLSDIKVAARASEHGDGLIVELYFTADTLTLSLRCNLVSNHESIFKPLRLLIPTSYPRCSPIISDEMPSESRNAPDDLLTTAKLKLQSSFRSMAHPMSIEDIVVSWERCVKEVINDYAEKRDGGTFSSNVGDWEMVKKP